MDTSRREFFKSTAKSTKKAVVEGWEQTVREKAMHWIRPPFAINELEFILSCTRCGVCIDSCKNDTLFSLSERHGVQFAHTPAMDLNNKACLLCEDWPCVDACVNGALSRLERPDQEKAKFRLAYISINKSACLPYQGPECGVCVDVCPVEGAIKLNLTKPEVDYSRCVGCAQCRVVCVSDPKAIQVFSRYQIEAN